MDDEMTTQLRTVSFSEERKGFDKREVREFLVEVAEWIEGGGGDVVRRRLERIAHKSAKMLADAEDGAEALRREAEQETQSLLDGARSEADSCRAGAEAEAHEQLREARVEGTTTREAANQYASETRTQADQYAEQTRIEAKRETDELREDAAEEARQAVRGAEQRAEQILVDANRQRQAIETVIGDLAVERDGVVSQVRRLALALEETADGVERDADKRAAGATRKKVKAPAVPAVEEDEAPEEPHAEPELARHSNGADPI
jgi:F0F1-type ATP synthase membrane subunit b/b'